MDAFDNNLVADDASELFLRSCSKMSIVPFRKDCLGFQLQLVGNGGLLYGDRGLNVHICQQARTLLARRMPAVSSSDGGPSRVQIDQVFGALSASGIRRWSSLAASV